jgi:hypothetical protein
MRETTAPCEPSFTFSMLILSLDDRNDFRFLLSDHRLSDHRLRSRDPRHIHGNYSHRYQRISLVAFF